MKMDKLVIVESPYAGNIKKKYIIYKKMYERLF